MTLRDRSVVPPQVRIAAAAVIFFAAGRAAGELIGWRAGAEYGRRVGSTEGWHEALKPLVASSEPKVSDAAFALVMLGPPEIHRRAG